MSSFLVVRCHTHKFSHQMNNQSTSTNLCSFFNSPKGCSRGVTCKFKHSMEKYDIKPCHFYKISGACKNGSLCLFSHEGKTPTKKEQQRQHGQSSFADTTPTVDLIKLESSPLVNATLDLHGENDVDQEIIVHEKEIILDSTSVVLRPDASTLSVNTSVRIINIFHDTILSFALLSLFFIYFHYF